MANELDEITGPINMAGNSNSKIIDFFGSKEIKSVSNSFGMVGSAALDQSNLLIIVDEPEQQKIEQKSTINNSLVKMINILASIDSILKQKFQNQRLLIKNEQLVEHESQIESTGLQPEIQIIKPDAVKENSGGAGLLALGGLALLTLDPVQEALKSVVDGVVSIGGFVTGMISSINDVFDFLLNGNAPAGVVPNTNENKVSASEKPQPSNNSNATPIPAQTPTQETTQPESKSSLLQSATTGALTGAAIGSFIPRIGPIVGAAIGGTTGAISYFTGGSTDSSSTTSSAKQTSAPAPTSNTSKSTASAPPSSMWSLNAKPKQENTNQTATKTDSKTNQKSAAAGNVIPVSHPDTGSGYGIVGANDAHGRPVAFSKEGAEAFAQMMADSNGIVKPSDIASSKRSIQKNASVDGATNSPHLRGVAMDIHGTSEPWIRQHGHKYGWKPHDYKGTHGGHFVFGGAGMTPDEGSSQGSSSGLASTVGEAVTGGLKAVGKLFGVLGSAIIKPGIAKTDTSSIIAGAAKELNADMAISKTEKPTPSLPPTPAPPNINKIEGGATQNPATAEDKNKVYYYLRRFGYQDLSIPEKKIVIA